MIWQARIAELEEELEAERAARAKVRPSLEYYCRRLTTSSDIYYDDLYSLSRADDRQDTANT